MAIYSKIPTETPDVFRVIIAGRVSTDIQRRETSSGKVVGNFRMLYSYVKSKAPTEKGEALSIRVACWNEVADIASMLEKGDQVIVFGRIYINDYETKKYGKKSWEVEAEEIIIPSCQAIAVEAHRMASSANSSGVAKGAPASQNDGLEDFDMNSIDDIFPDSSL